MEARAGTASPTFGSGCHHRAPGLNSPLLLGVFTQPLADILGAKDIAGRIGRNPFATRLVLVRIGARDEGCDYPVLGIADPNAAPAARIGSAALLVLGLRVITSFLSMKTALGRPNCFHLPSGSKIRIRALTRSATNTRPAESSAIPCGSLNSPCADPFC